MQSKKMNIELMRKFNTATVLKIIHNEGPISRAEIADHMSLSRPSVSEIVTELVQDGWIRETPSASTGRGRPSIPLEIDPSHWLAAGIAIEAHQVLVMITSLAAEVVAEQDFPIDWTMSPEDVLEKACTVLDGMMSERNLERDRIVGLGVAMHGIVNYKEGLSIYAPNLGWRDVPIRSFFEERTGLHTVVESDCNSSALAELWFGKARRESHFITVLDDYGLGAGIIIDGQVYRGSNYIEGQIGHTMVDENGPQCACGNYGCLEVMSSESAIVRNAMKRLRIGEQSVLRTSVPDSDQLKIEHVYQAAQAGDNMAREVVSQAARYLGIGLATLITLFGPKFVILGGGIVRVADIVIPLVREMVEQRAFGEIAKHTPIIASTFGSQLYPIGAATLAIEHAFREPNGERNAG